jgi:hypothetical protein
VVVEEVVAAVSVDVCADVSLMVTDVGERLQVAGLVALEGVLVTAQERETVPVNEFDGVTVMVAVLVEPGLTLMAPLLAREKLVLPLGACQKFPQPANSGAAASNTRAHVPILIAAPWPPVSCGTPLRV